MPDALLSGVSNPEQLAELSKARMRLKIPQLREALASRFTIDHHGVMVAPLLAHIDTLDAAIENLNRRIELVLAPHAELIELPCTIPGVHVHVAQVLVAECGLDMSAFPTVGHSPMPEPSRSPPTASLAASARATSGGGTRCRTRSCLAPATCPARGPERIGAAQLPNAQVELYIVTTVSGAVPSCFPQLRPSAERVGSDWATSGTSCDPARPALSG